MYHDQALIPIKTLAFDHAVNVTLGLPFVRTSPDHGTAFDIAGTGKREPREPRRGAQARGAARQARTATGAGEMSASTPAAACARSIRRHGLSARKSLGQNFLLDLNLTGRIARAAGPARWRDGDRGRSRTRRADARAARPKARARVIAVERDERAIAALAEIAAHYPGRLTSSAGDALTFDVAPLSRRRPGAHRRQPALQHRDRAARRLAHRRAVAALVRPPYADVPARGRRAHRGEARLEDLRPALGAGGLAHGGENPVRHRAVGLRAAAEGDVLAGAVRPARRCPCPAIAARWSASPRRRSASAARCCAQSLQSLGIDPIPLLENAGLDPTARAEDIAVEGFVALAKRTAHDAHDPPIDDRLCDAAVRDDRRGARAARNAKCWCASAAAACAIPTCTSAGRLFQPRRRQEARRDAPSQRTLPFTLGHEIAGVVEKAGPDATVKTGQSFAVFPWIGCSECAACKAGEENLCAAPRHLGIQVDGGFATHVLVPHERYLIDHTGLPASLAGAYMCSGLTAFAALKRIDRACQARPAAARRTRRRRHDGAGVRAARCFRTRRSLPTSIRRSARPR